MNLFALEAGIVSASGSSSTSTFVGRSSGSSHFRESLSITSTPLNGKNYATWAKFVEVYYQGETKLHYLTDDPPQESDKTILHG